MKSISANVICLDHETRLLDWRSGQSNNSWRHTMGWHAHRLYLIMQKVIWKPNQTFQIGWRIILLLGTKPVGICCRMFATPLEKNRKWYWTLTMPRNCINFLLPRMKPQSSAQHAQGRIYDTDCGHSRINEVVHSLALIPSPVMCTERDPVQCHRFVPRQTVDSLISVSVSFT